MNEKAVYPQFVVTVLRDNMPQAVISLQQDSDSSREVDVHHHPSTELPPLVEILRSAASSLEYLTWKAGGPIPAARDYEYPGEPDNDRPF